MSNTFTQTTPRRPGSAVMAALVTLAVVLVAASLLSGLSGAGELAVDLGAAAAAVMVLAVLLAAVRRPPNLDVRVVAGELRVRFHGWDALWSLRREVRIPVDHDSLWSGWWHRPCRRRGHARHARPRARCSRSCGPRT
ncbi:MAG: hypothetical protein ABWY81_10335 [Jiangellaceae bacterium]